MKDQPSSREQLVHSGCIGAEGILRLARELDADLKVVMDPDSSLRVEIRTRDQGVGDLKMAATSQKEVLRLLIHDHFDDVVGRILSRSGAALLLEFQGP